MNDLKKKELSLENEIRKLKRKNLQLQKENKLLKEENWRFKWLNEYNKQNSKLKKCDHKFVDGKKCIKCGWMP